MRGSGGVFFGTVTKPTTGSVFVGTGGDGGGTGVGLLAHAAVHAANTTLATATLVAIAGGDALYWLGRHFGPLVLVEWRHPNATAWSSCSVSGLLTGMGG